MKRFAIAVAGALMLSIVMVIFGIIAGRDHKINVQAYVDLIHDDIYQQLILSGKTPEEAEDILKLPFQPDVKRFWTDPKSGITYGITEPHQPIHFIDSSGEFGMILRCDCDTMVEITFDNRKASNR